MAVPSSSGYGNSLSLKDIRDDDLDEIEKSMRKTDEAFEFRLGNRKLIIAVADYVKGIVDSNGKNTGLSFFTNYNDESLESPHAPKKTNGNGKINNFLLNKLVTTAEKNSPLDKHAYRYDSDIKMYASYLRMITGPMAYETIQKNLESALPSLVSVNRYINASGCHINEAILRVEELKLFLAERSLSQV